MTSESLAAAMLVQHKRIVAALQAHIGTAWKEVYSEPHLHYMEIPVWVLLYDDSDPSEVHGVFRRTIVPFLDGLGELQLTLMYYVVRDGVRYHLDFLGNTAEILSADGEALGEWQKESASRFWLFTANNSQRP